MRRMPDPGSVQPLERGFVGRLRRGGAPAQSVADLHYHQSPEAIAYNSVDPNRPPKSHGYKVISYVQASIRLPDGDDFGLDGHIRTCIQVGPMLGNVAQNFRYSCFP